MCVRIIRICEKSIWKLLNPMLKGLKWKKSCEFINQLFGTYFARSENLQDIFRSSILWSDFAHRKSEAAKNTLSINRKFHCVASVEFCWGGHNLFFLCHKLYSFRKGRPFEKDVAFVQMIVTNSSFIKHSDENTQFKTQEIHQWLWYLYATLLRTLWKQFSFT